MQDDYASDSSTSSTGTISTITVELCHDVNSAQSQHPLIYCEMLINDKPVRLQIDCGATVCILPKRYLKNLKVRPEIVNLQMWNKSSVKTLGKCKVHVKNSVTNERFLQRCSEIGISLNKEKCRFGLSEIPFMGHVVSNKGLKPDPSKVEAILKMEPPTDKAGVERLRGTVNYLSRFVSKLTDVMRTISDLTRPNIEWSWTPSHNKAFEEIKHLLTVAAVLAYFDPSKELSI